MQHTFRMHAWPVCAEGTTKYQPVIFVVEYYRIT